VSGRGSGRNRVRLIVHGANGPLLLGKCNLRSRHARRKHPGGRHLGRSPSPCAAAAIVSLAGIASAPNAPGQGKCDGGLADQEHGDLQPQKKYVQLLRSRRLTSATVINSLALGNSGSDRTSGPVLGQALRKGKFRRLCLGGAKSCVWVSHLVLLHWILKPGLGPAPHQPLLSYLVSGHWARSRNRRCTLAHPLYHARLTATFCLPRLAVARTV